ncbi:GAJ protein [Zopfochytrium polystomum]|nr:GAJ protein [Zopfochytrium polystomum]
MSGSGARKKGLSVDEKKKKMLEIFHESMDFFTLKDIEKIAPKQKGIVQNTVKDILDQLVSDDLVTMEKIGTSNYFWSFPGAAIATKKRKLESLEAEEQKLKQRKIELEGKIQKAEEGREKSDERDELLKLVEEQEAKAAELREELRKYKDCDPATLDAKEKAAEQAKEAANRWTDNIFIVQSYCSNKFNIPSEEFCRMFEIPEDLDSIP